MPRVTTVCKKCQKTGTPGLAWVTKEQIEDGVTTKKGKWDMCPCCDGDWRDCQTCAEEERQYQEQ